MAEKMTYVNPEMLKWAREFCDLELEEVEPKFEKSDVSAWENGSDFPTYKQLKDLSSMYRKPVAVFFFPEPPAIKKVIASCRTLPAEIHSSLSREVIKLFDDARVMQINLYELHDNSNPWQLKISNIEFSSQNIEIIAKELRSIMNTPISKQKKVYKISDAFEFWRDAFYQLGIYVFKEAFQDDSVSGFSLYDDEFPVIYINNSLSFTRQIFTLFHEIYHIISNTSGIDLINDTELQKYSNVTNLKIEQACNAFAGEFLVPDSDFLTTSQGISIDDESVSKLAQLYSVSREVILRRLLDNGRISGGLYDEKQREFNEDYLRFKEIKGKDKNSGGNYYNTQLAYKGMHYTNLTFGLYYSQKINVLQLSKYMNMKIPSIQALAVQKGWGAI